MFQPKIALAASALVLCSAYLLSPRIVVNVPSTQPPITVQTGNGATPTPDNRLLVDGFAQLSIQPDCLDLMLTLAAENQRPDRAVADVRKRQEALLKSVTPLSLRPQDMTLGLVSVDPIYEYDELGRQHRRGYKASISMVVTLHEFDRIGELMQYAADSGAESFQTRFRSTELVKRKAEVRAMALKAAKEKAEQTANALGTQLGAVLSVQEVTPNAWAANEYANAYRAVQPAEAPGIQAEALDLSLTVQVAYRLGSV